MKAGDISVVQAGDGCSTNIKAAKPVASQLGVKAPMSKCASHASQCMFALLNYLEYNSLYFCEEEI